MGAKPVSNRMNRHFQFRVSALFYNVTAVCAFFAYAHVVGPPLAVALLVAATLVFGFVFSCAWICYWLHSKPPFAPRK